MWSYTPLVTPVGKPGNNGVVVATPAVLTPGTAVQQWMCEAVVVPVRPLKETCTCIVLPTVSKSTSANPVPSEVLGGTSLAPLRLAKKLIRVALALLLALPRKRRERRTTPEGRIMGFLHAVDARAPRRLNQCKKRANSK